MHPLALLDTASLPATERLPSQTERGTLAPEKPAQKGHHMQQSIRLDGKTALVTGASSGLGWRFAQVLAQAGARVALAARSADKLEQLKREIEQAGGKACAMGMRSEE